jgi:hypothetical protein
MMLLNNILFLLACVAFAAVAWMVFHLLGQYTFPMMLIITMLALLARVCRPKLRGKNRLT